MLQERDYILRLIAMSGEMVRRAMERIRGGQPAEALKMLEGKKEDRPWKKHGNIPL